MRHWILCALLLACKREPPPPAPPPPAPVDAGPAAIEEKEPNDYQRAQEIPRRSVVRGELSAPRDEDWFRIGAGAGRTLSLRVELKGVTSAEMEVTDRDRNRLLRVRAGGEDPGVIPAVACQEACFLKVAGSGPQKYELTALGAEPLAGHELEPNDRAVDANELLAGKPMQGSFYSPDDDDWYRLALSPDAGQFLRIETSVVEGVREELEVRALQDGALLGTFAGGSVRDLSMHLGETPDAGGGGDYLVLKGRSKDGGPR